MWGKWIKYTHRRASELAQLDKRLYGTGFIQKCWWGWKYVPAETVVIFRTKEGKYGRQVNTST